MYGRIITLCLRKKRNSVGNNDRQCPKNVFGRITVNDLFIYLFVNLLVIFMVSDTACKI